MRAKNLRFARHAIDADRDLGATRFEPDAFGLKADLYALRLEDFADRIRNFLILARYEPRRLFDNRDLCS